MAFPLRFPPDKPLVTVTHPKPSIWVIEMHNGDDSRLTAIFIKSGLIPAFDAVERDWREGWRATRKSKDKNGAHGALIIVGNMAQHKFFSNGLDYDNAIKNPDFFPTLYNPMITRLLTFPIPTIAAINGHCFAGAFMLSLACDYRVMIDGSKRNAWMCMNEIHFGAGWPAPFGKLLRAKVSDPRIVRRIALEGHRFTPREALQAGLLDHLVAGNSQDVLNKAEEVGEVVSSCAQSGVWGIIKREIYGDILEASIRDVASSRRDVLMDDAAAKARL